MVSVADMYVGIENSIIAIKSWIYQEKKRFCFTTSESAGLKKDDAFAQEPTMKITNLDITFFCLA